MVAGGHHQQHVLQRAPAARSYRHDISQGGGGIHKVSGGVHLDVGVPGLSHWVSTHGGNKDTKVLLKQDTFSTRLANLLPTWRDGLTVSHPNLSALEKASLFSIICG